MSTLDKAIMQLGMDSIQLAAEKKALKAENERLLERVKDLERQLADAYARIAEMAKGPTISTESPCHPLDAIYTTCGTAHGNMTVIDNNPKPTEQ